MYDKNEDTFREQTPKNTAVEKHRYSYVRSNGTRVSDAESFLAWLDSLAAPLLKKLHRRKRLNDEECAVLTAFISCMFVRVPEFENMINTTTKDIARDLGNRIFGPEEMAKYEIGVNKGFSLAMRLKLVSELGVEFDNFDWHFHRAAKDTAFVTCDNPLTKMPPPGVDPNTVGIAIPGVLKAIPLTSLVCLVMRDRGRGLSYQPLPKTFVKWFNQNLALNCTRFVIARDEAHLRNIVGFAKRVRWKKAFEW